MLENAHKSAEGTAWKIESCHGFLHRCTVFLRAKWNVSYLICQWASVRTCDAGFLCLAGHEMLKSPAIIIIVTGVLKNDTFRWFREFHIHHSCSFDAIPPEAQTSGKSKSDGRLESSKVCWSGDLIAIVPQKVLMYVIWSLSLNILRMLLKVSQTYLQILTIRIQWL